MVDNIFAQGLNGRICPQHTLHLPQHLFAFFNRCSVRLLFQCVVGRINQGQCILVEVEFDNTALVVNRTRCAILHSLCHIVNIDIITKNFTRISIFCRNRRSRKAYVGCIWQGIMDDTGIANDRMCFFFALFIFFDDNFLIKTILSTVGFIRHHHNISPFGQRLLATLKLEHRGEDNAICFSTIQQVAQIFLAGCLYRYLAQKRRTLGKLRVKLIVKVNAVSHHNNSWTVQSFLQQMGIEYHRQRFSTALRMPEHTALAIRFGGNFGLFNSFSHRKILVVSSQNLNRLLPITGKQDKIFQNIQQSCFLEHSLIECVKLRIRRIFVIAILCFPLHKTVKSRSDCSRLIGRKVTDYADCIIIEHRRNVLHIVPNLVICVFCAHFVLGRAL